MLVYKQNKIIFHFNAARFFEWHVLEWLINVAFISGIIKPIGCATHINFSSDH